MGEMDIIFHYILLTRKEISVQPVNVQIKDNLSGFSIPRPRYLRTIEISGGPVLRFSALISRPRFQSLDRERKILQSLPCRKKQSKDNLELSLLARANQVSGHRHRSIPIN